MISTVTAGSVQCVRLTTILTLFALVFIIIVQDTIPLESGQRLRVFMALVPILLHTERRIVGPREYAGAGAMETRYSTISRAQEDRGWRRGVKQAGRLNVGVSRRSDVGAGGRTIKIAIGTGMLVHAWNYRELLDRTKTVLIGTGVGTGCQGQLITAGSVCRAMDHASQCRGPAAIV